MTSSEPELFRTTFEVGRAPFALSPEQGSLVLLGSCFSDEIGARLQACGYPCAPNPCGTLYNPFSIQAVVSAALSGKMPEDVFFEHEGRWRCWLLPTRFSSPDKEECKRICLDALHTLREALLSCEALIITLGTARVYRHLPDSHSPFPDIVGNCHKVPPRAFEVKGLGVAQCCEAILSIASLLHAHNIGARIIFTVSPIRHFKDGAHTNTLSKATLHLAVQQALDNMIEGVMADYFPAWELMQDDLRDYRFYAADMLHPSPVAADYIWHRFASRYFTPATRTRLAARTRELRRAAHRPLLS